MGKKVIITVTTDLVGDQRVHRMALTLSQAGMDVSVIGRVQPVSKPLPNRPYKARRISTFFMKGKFFYAEIQIRLFFILMFSKVDVLHCNDLDTLLPNFLVSRLRKKPLVYDSHEYFTEVPELIRRPSTRKIWLKVEEWIFPKLRHVMTVNKSLAEIYGKKYRLKVHSVRNLPLRRDIGEREFPAQKILLYQGALNVGRGIDLMIRAMHHLPGYTLWIAGKGDQEAELKALVEAENLSSQVQFKGWVPLEELDLLTRTASLGFSLEEALGENYLYALPNKLFDYIQCGVPVIVSDLPEMRRVVDEYGVGEVLNLTDRDPVKLAAKVTLMLEKGRWLELNRACAKAGETLNWEAEKGKVLEIYEKLRP